MPEPLMSFQDDSECFILWKRTKVRLSRRYFIVKLLVRNLRIWRTKLDSIKQTTKFFLSRIIFPRIEKTVMNESLCSGHILLNLSFPSRFCAFANRQKFNCENISVSKTSGHKRAGEGRKKRCEHILIWIIQRIIKNSIETLSLERERFFQKICLRCLAVWLLPKLVSVLCALSKHLSSPKVEFEFRN